MHLSFRAFIFMEEKIQDKTSSSTRRIAKNTLMLYFRQILIMVVSLCTVRVVLNTLGAEDYGIYNVVAGVVVLFSFVNNAMATATQRFLNFNLGKNDTEKTQQTYSASLLIHIGIAFIFVFLAETIGLWFVNSKLNVPVERHGAAMWCYQFSIITTVFNILRVPYNAVIIAYEKMSFFARVSIVEAVLKLLVVYLLIISPLDKLVAYVILLAFVSVIILFCYKIYCNKKFEITYYKRIRDISLIKEILGFSGWSLFGATANVANQQGTNIVLNMFTNVTVNAAMGIANQVNSAVYSFVSNFQTAFNPQLVKSYAAGKRGEFTALVIQSAKFSFYLLWLIVLPLYLNCELILTLWLKDVPDYTVGFVRLILMYSLVESINGPLYIAIQATGKIKFYQIIVGLINLSNLPLIIVAFCFGASPLWIMYIRIALNVIALFFRLFLVKKYTCFTVLNFVKKGIVLPVIITFLSVMFTNMISNHFNQNIYFWVSCSSSLLCTLTLIYLIGFSKNERVFLLKKLREGIKK